MNYTTTYQANHNIYGGEITLADFDTSHPNKKRIDSIARSLNMHKSKFVITNMKGDFNGRN